MSAPGVEAGSAEAAESTASDPRTGNGFLGDVLVNAKRWNRKAIRNPTVIALELSMAVLSLLVFSAVFGEAGALALEQRGFGDLGYVSFLMPAVILQVTMAAAFRSGIGLVEDFDSGMFEKVVVAPMSATAVFVGKSVAELGRILLQALLVLGLAVAMGATIETGFVGVVGIVAVCLLFAMWYSAISNVLAVLTRDAEVLDAASMILLFPLLFLSSSFLPVSALPGPVQAFATINPVTYGVDAVRALVLDRDVMTVVEVSRFGGIYDTLVPAFAVLITLNVVFGAVAVLLLSRASSATAA